MLNKFKIAETENFSKKIKSKKYEALYSKIFDNVYPLIKSNPFFGINIKKLKGECSDLYRFGIRHYKLFYMVDEKKLTIFVIDIENKQTVK